MINHLKSVFYDYLSTDKIGLFFLWVPVFLGGGVALYFGMTTEPRLYISFTCLVISGVTTYYLRNNYFVFLSTLIITIVFAGFISAQLRTHFLDVRLLPNPVGPKGIQGRILKLEDKLKGQRIILEDLQIARIRADHVPTRLRLLVNKPNPNLKVGQWIETWAKIKPVPQPTSPNAFDLQRHLFFQQIGALGFSIGEIKIIEQSKPLEISFTALFGNLRKNIIKRIDLALGQGFEDSTKALAKTFLTGNKKFLDEETHESIRASGLAHLLAISGLHIGLASMMCFLTIRQILSLIPAIALKYPIKKWAAVGAIMGALFYTLLTGASIPTLRAFIMCAFAFGAILIDRKAISLRSVALAAIFILLLFPESLLSASFQLSFAAVTALVAFYERRKVFIKQNKVLRYFKEIFSSSLIAGTATMPFAAYHFHKIAVYGLFSNLAAIPITVFWIMPFGMLALIMMPIGFEQIPLMVMGWGIESLVWVAKQTAGLPYAALKTGVISNLTFILIVCAGLFICLIPHKLRFVSLGLVPIIALIYLTTPQAILKVSNDGKLLAFKTKEQGIAFSNLRSARFIRENWLDQWAHHQGNVSRLRQHYNCDQFGCTILTSDQTRISFNRNPVALWEDCRNSQIVIATTSKVESCKKPDLIIDLQDLRDEGAHALYQSESGYYFETVKDKRGVRPWTNYN